MDKADLGARQSQPVGQVSRQRSSILDVVNVLVLIATLLVIVWYTVETRRLRQATEEQIRRSYLPLIVLEFRGDRFAENRSDKVRLFIRNVGFGPAFNIQISPFGHLGYNADFASVSGLGINGELELIPRISRPASEETTSQTHPASLGDLLAILPPRSHSVENRFPVEITYTDIRGAKQKLSQEVVWSAEESGTVRAFLRSVPEEIRVEGDGK